MLLWRTARALWVFGVIFSSYLFHIALTKLFPSRPPWLVKRKRRVDTKNAKRLLASTLKLRGVYIKLGQVLSIMGGFLPQAYAKELESLQDQVPPQPYGVIKEAIQRSLKQTPEQAYNTFSRTPIAAASLGQVHEAALHDGTRVAVKILYPGIKNIIRVDMKVIGLAMRVYKWFVPVDNIETIHAALTDLLARETDYRHEAACMERMTDNFQGQKDILFPTVISDLSTDSILTMTFMEGLKISHVEEYEHKGIDRKQIAKRLVESFYKQLFVDRFFHADPHPGNFLVREEDGSSRIVILDFGAISEVKQDTVDGMVKVLRGFFEQRDELVLEGVEQIGFVAPGGDRSLLEDTVKTYFQKLMKIEDRSAGALMRANLKELEELADPEVERQQLRGLMRSVRYPDGWFYVERAVVLMFWLSAQIDPEMDTLQVGFPYVLPLIAEQTQKANAPTS